ncbi:solute carrier family 52, riboflavin transporter, member 3-A [Lepeophtheirus salmonis]|uniref:solute carrier family 52, riboflavin transporter, member 3-A n=1 Tax=Lepeophtheirus salmonis TaxID=72036 RepID=UPI001AE5E4AA|nr:solute carrier family 52, riboflavin transporter, member 3-A-like [Lepeophtheirus salmonis]
MLGNRSLHFDILTIFFGISAWISINGLWVELPLLVQRLPEKWNLASYLSVIIQVANLGPLLYSLLRCWFGENRFGQIIAIYLLLLVGTISSFILALGWNITTIFGDTQHSYVLFILVFFLSFVDCTSSVLFLPYMVFFREIYLNSYLIGEGLSGFIPSMVALLQGSGGNPTCVNISDSNGTWEVQPHFVEPRFSIQSFFFFLFCMMAISSAAFTIMNLLPKFKNEMSSSITTSMIINEGNKNVPEEMKEVCYNFPNNTTSSESSKTSIVFLLSLQSFICFLSNGALPSIQTFSCLPYGNTVYHLSVTLNAMANPLMAFLAFFLPCKCDKTIGFLTTIGGIFAFFVFITALHSPKMLWGQYIGGFLTTFSWVIYGGLFSYVKISIAGTCRSKSNSALFWCGVVTQIGSALGAFIMFFIVNYCDIFKAYYVSC